MYVLSAPPPANVDERPSVLSARLDAKNSLHLATLVLKLIARVLRRVLELQESPCLPGGDIAFAVEGDASLLAKHGPLPRRSYVILVRPRRRRARGSRNRDGGSENSSSDGSTTASSERAGVGLATFDAGYNWHGRDESPAVEQV